MTKKYLSSQLKLNSLFFSDTFLLALISWWKLVRLTKFRNFYAAHLAEIRFEKAHMTSMRDVT